MRSPYNKSKTVTSLPLPNVDEQKVNVTAEKANAVPNKAVTHSYQAMDSEATRNFKSTTMPFNEYEHTLLMAATVKAGYKSTKQFMRDAYIAKALKIIEGKPE